MTLSPPTEAAAMMVRVRCLGTRKRDGALCPTTLVIVDQDLLESGVLYGKQTLKCPECGKIEDFSRWR